MAQYSEQDLEYAAEFREGIHREALAIVRRTRPSVKEVIDRHPVEDYFQEHWDYPGKWYTIIAIPYGYKSRKALVDTIVRDTLAENAPEEKPEGDEERFAAEIDPRDGCSCTAGTDSEGRPADDPFYALVAEYPDLVVDYCIVPCGRYCGYESHRTALETAFVMLCEGWDGDPNRAVGKSVAAGELFSPIRKGGNLNYRKAFLKPPHTNRYTDSDFDRVNEVLFPKGTDALEVCEWTTDWSEYFDDGREWWGTLCLTVYDKTLDRFVVIMASATD